MPHATGSDDSSDAPPASRLRETRLIFNYCAAFLVLFGAISFFSVRNSSATFDEPLHLVGGVIHRYYGDFRINPEDPALFGAWASLPHSRGAIKLDLEDPRWKLMHQAFGPHQWPFVAKTLYQTPENDADALLLKSRLMFLPIGILVGVLIVWCAWKVGGAGAALIAAGLFSFDPNFLAHAPLVKNDVMLAGLMLITAIGLWRFGQRGTIGSLAAFTIATALAVNVKFSGVLLGPMIALVLGIRAIMREPWVILGRRLETVLARLAVVGVICIGVGITVYVTIWASYGFRFFPTPGSEVLHETSEMVEMIRFNRQAVGQPRELGPVIDTLLWMQTHRILPQAWVQGFLYTYATTIARTSWLLGERSNSGWWYYFPLAMLVKTPLATLLAGAIALLGNLRAVSIERRWVLIALSVPPLIYVLSSLNSGMNIGIRHMLPVYPFIFIGIGAGLASIWRRNKRVMALVCMGLMAGVIAETATAYPNYISFFNSAAGGSRGGLGLLSDSNIDWGQDLRRLVQWRERNRGKPIFLAYFGIAEPGYYKLDQRMDVTFMPGGTKVGSDLRLPGGEPCYVAVSAAVLQGVYQSDPDLIRFYATLRAMTPLTVVGGSIYIYEF